MLGIQVVLVGLNIFLKLVANDGMSLRVIVFREFEWSDTKKHSFFLWTQYNNWITIF